MCFHNFCNCSRFCRRLPSRALAFCTPCIKKTSFSRFCCRSPMNSVNGRYNAGEQVNIVLFYGYAVRHARLAARRSPVTQYGCPHCEPIENGWFSPSKEEAHEHSWWQLWNCHSPRSSVEHFLRDAAVCKYIVCAENTKETQFNENVCLRFLALTSSGEEIPFQLLFVRWISSCTVCMYIYSRWVH